jgi:hypothetical protein
LVDSDFGVVGFRDSIQLDDVHAWRG